jgi:hypothetical protein
MVVGKLLLLLLLLLCWWVPAETGADTPYFLSDQA